MKIKLNQLSKITLFLFSLLLLSCEKDENSPSNIEKNIKREVKLSEIPNLFNSIQNRQHNINHAKNSTDYLSLINTESITEISQSNGNKTYTFSLNINETDTLTNLVAIENNNGFDYHLVQYSSSQLEQWKDDIHNHQNTNVLVDVNNIPLSSYTNSTENICTETGWTCPSGQHNLNSLAHCVYPFIEWSMSTYTVPCDDNSGGGSSSGSNNPNPIPEPYTEPVFPTLSPEIAIFIANLSPTQTIWWNNADNNVKNDILNYLTQNIKNGEIKTEAQQFINELIGVLAANPQTIYTSTDYPGKNNGMPFEWWKDNDYMTSNFEVLEEDPNPAELLAFSLFPDKALLHIQNSTTALNKTQQLVLNNTLTGIEDGRADAFRHAYWNALGTAEFGSNITQIFTDAHEAYSSGLPRQMDLHNNLKGREKALIMSFNFLTSDSVIADSILIEVYVGHLLFILNGVLTPTD
ncbi:DUF6973 domain-containing protein [Flavobacterium cyclinae]|uniref:DUF6973 domain-containing protein n=1 Tax=Flavobacterium cyclinae TaxID=2895947 RepID=UPI001E4A12A5|nr:hypothetical protein [Flavobacterium cyclinae]UGS19837.1 hypothetical protein LOS86_07350 [Flavobacterium cyclinae]